MTTATIESAADTRRAAPGQRTRTAAQTSPKLVDARMHAESAVTDLFASTADTVRTLVPSALLRPSDAINTAFDLAEQCLAIARRTCLELASLVEGGLDGFDRRATA
jgi:hypothetical protein